MEQNKTKRRERFRNQEQTRIFIIIILIGYLFFFTSNITIPPPLTDKSEVTKINTLTEYGEERSYRLLSATYDEDKEMMEILLQLSESSIEEVNEYYYAITLNRGNVRKTEVIEAVNTDLVTVVRISGLKPSFREVTLMLAPKEKDIEEVSDDETAFIVINRYNMRKDSIDLDTTEEEYLARRLNTVISQYYETKTEYENKYTDTVNAIESLNDELDRINQSMAYMTSEEISQTDDRIAEAKEEIAALEKKKNSYAAKIKEQEELIEDAEIKLSDITENIPN